MSEALQPRGIVVTIDIYFPFFTFKLNILNNLSGDKGIRTPDLFHAMEARYQLRHIPVLYERVTLAHVIWHISARFFTEYWLQDRAGVMFG